MAIGGALFGININSKFAKIIYFENSENIGTIKISINNDKASLG